MSPPADRPRVDEDGSTADLPKPPRVRDGRAFEPGDLLAGRFRVVRFLAAGGMGEVWEVDDGELGERLAIKTIRPEIAEDESAMARFRREVQLARRVTHPSVCRTFEIFRHAGVTFVSMELLEGDTLKSEIRRRGRFATEDALPIVRQVAGALAAAHEQGIVHRDLKSSNVMLVPSPRGVRAVVTDFGLARLSSGTGDGGATLTAAGMMMGTPATMSPEQVSGGEITPASDVYGLGLLLYEMVTGRLPFEDDAPFVLAMRRLREDPPPPSRYAGDLDPDWEAAILRCLDRDPAKRFSGTGELVRALGGEIDTWTGTASTTARRRPRSRGWRLAAAALTILATAGVAAVWRFSKAGASAPSGVPGERRSVAVLGFQNLARAAEVEWLDTALTEMLAVELGAGDLLRTVPGETVARMRLELEVPDVASLAPETIERVHRHLGSDFLVTGSYLSTPGDDGRRIRLDLRIEDARTATTVAQLTENGTDRELLELVSRAGESLRRALGLAQTADRRLGTLPRRPEAARLYAEGLVKLRHFDALAARDLFVAAIEVEPDAPLVHSALAEAWSVLGHDPKAAEEARRALDLGGELSREDRLLVEGRYHLSRSEWERAVAVFRSLHEFYPDDLDYGLRLAGAQLRGGDPQGAVATLDRLRALPAPDGDDPRIDLVEASADEVLSLFEPSLAAARRALERGRARDARLLVAQAHYRIARGHWRLRELDKALETVAPARQLFAALGDPVGEADCLELSGNVLRNQGDREAARAALEEALAVYRRVGHESGVASATANLAILRNDEGDLEEAERLYRETLDNCRARGDKYTLAIDLNNLASIVRRQGRVEEGRDLLAESLQISRELGDRAGVGIRSSNLGTMLRRMGDFDGALALYQEALAVGREVGDERRLTSRLNSLGWLRFKRGELAEARPLLEEAESMLPEEPISTAASIHNSWGSLLAEEGDIPGARKRFEKALAIRRELGLGRTELDLIGLIGLDIDEERYAEAQAGVRRVFDQPSPESPLGPCETLALDDLMVVALLGEAEIAEAGRFVSAGEEPAASCEEMEPLAFHAVAKARWQTATGHFTEARRGLESVLVQANRSGWPLGRFEARLGLAEVDRAAGQLEAAADRFRSIEADATALGFRRIAEKARALLEQIG